MRPILLVFLTVVIVIGLPRLADRFRDGNLRAPSTANARADMQADSEGAAHAEGRAVTVPPPFVPVALQPPLSGGAAALPVPATQKELVVAIKKELTRLGYYDGPVTPRWSKGVRLAARRFFRQSRGDGETTLPSVKLLAALQSSQPTARPEDRQASESYKPYILGAAKTDDTALEARLDRGKAHKHSHHHKKHRQARSRRAGRTWAIPGF